jgi:type III secretion protein Q
MTCREIEPELSWLAWHDKDGVALHNRLHLRRETWQGECAGHALRVQWAGAAPMPDSHVPVLLGLGETWLTLHVPARVLQTFGIPHPGDFTALSGSMRLELALLPLIESLEQLAGLPVRVLDAMQAARLNVDEQPWVLEVVMALQIAQNDPVAVPLQLTRQSAVLIADLLDRHAIAAAAELSLLRLPLTVESGEARLNMGELRSLNPGDVLMLDHWPDTQVRLVLEQRLQARAELDGHTLTLLEAPTAMNFMKEHPMTETTVGQGLDTTLDELPLKLVCQVGSVELSLAQLRALGAGSLVELTPQLQDSVDLMVNGRRIGQGQLVKIGDGLGVRLLSFATP